MAGLERVRVWAEALIRLHLDEREWSFRFDNAKTRAGSCDYQKREITVSKYLATRFGDDEIHQVLLHEVAHALAGKRSAHGPKWLRIARDLGYDGNRTHNGPVESEFARWVGFCPAGHEIIRFRKPTRPVSCGKCSRSFSRAHLISWAMRSDAQSSTSTSFQNAT